MKISNIVEASYHGQTFVIEEHSDAGTNYFIVPKEDVQRLKEILATDVKVNKHTGKTYSEVEQELFDEAEAIFDRAERYEADLIFDWFNFELTEKR